MGELKPRGHVDPEIDKETKRHIGAGKVRETTRIIEPYEKQSVWRSLPRNETPPPAVSIITPVLTEEDLVELAQKSAEAARPLEEIEYPGFVNNKGYDVDETGPSLLSDREVALRTSSETGVNLEEPPVAVPVSANDLKVGEDSKVPTKTDLTPSKSTATHSAKGWSSTLPAAAKIIVSLWAMMVVGTHLGTNFGFAEFFPGSTAVTALLLIFGGIAIIARGLSPLAAKKERRWIVGGVLILTGVINLTASSFFSSQWLLRFFLFF